MVVTVHLMQKILEDGGIKIRTNWLKLNPSVPFNYSEQSVPADAANAAALNWAIGLRIDPYQASSVLPIKIRKVFIHT
ncbi:MAG: hypothetical protein ACI9VT_002329 [Psychroserpens sp.]